MWKPARLVSGVPLVFCVGASQPRVALPLAGAVTVMLNGASDADADPSLTLITIFLNVPAFALDGVPASLPELLLKLAHDGRFATENVSGLPSGSLALGVNAYSAPSATLVAGVPLITGGGSVGRFTWIENP